jgi:uncharacterized membrane protein YcjF (UPF0283 family)
MPESRQRRKPAVRTPLRRRWDWRRVAGGVSEYLRNLSLIVLTAQLVEPLITRQPVAAPTAAAGVAIALVFFAVSVIFDHERRD